MSWEIISFILSIILSQIFNLTGNKYGQIFIVLNFVLFNLGFFKLFGSSFIKTIIYLIIAAIHVWLYYTNNDAYYKFFFNMISLFLSVEGFMIIVPFLLMAIIFIGAAKSNSS